MVTSAGLQAALAGQSQGAPAASPRRQRVALVRQVLRKPDATDDEMDDALEALLELAKDTGD